MRCERGAIVGGDLFVQPLEYRSLVRMRVAGPSAQERVFQSVQDWKPATAVTRRDVSASRGVRARVERPPTATRESPAWPAAPSPPGRASAASGSPPCPR